MDAYTTNASRGIEVDEPDRHLLACRNWNVVRLGYTKYAVAKLHGKTTYLHRLIMQAPAGMEVDHRDGNGLNNRRENLRLVTRTQNLFNPHNRRLPQCGYRGVSPEGKRWVARAQLGRKR